MERIIETLMHQNLMVINKGTEEHPDYVVGGTNDLKRELVKLFAIPVVMQRSELLLFADYYESDKTSQTTDEVVDNYLAEKSNSA